MVFNVSFPYLYYKDIINPFTTGNGIKVSVNNEAFIQSQNILNKQEQGKYVQNSNLLLNCFI